MSAASISLINSDDNPSIPWLAVLSTATPAAHTAAVMNT